MQSLRSILPPMDTLATFEAAARLQSFTKAGNELCLTQAAVSRQIKLLEDDLGTCLFVRSHRSVKLTQEGKSFYSTVVLAITHISNAAVDLRDKPATEQLTIAVDQSIAWLWLMPRLARFRNQYPDINVRLIASDDKRDQTDNGVDIAIAFGPNKWSGFSSQLLFEEEIFPVCSPEFLAKNPISHIEDLLAYSVLELEDDQWGWVNWRAWLTENGVLTTSKMLPVLMNNYPLILQSAKNGLGIALGWKHLVDEMLHNKELVIPLEAYYRSDNGYYLLIKDTEPLTVSQLNFKHWALEEMQHE